MQHRWFFIFMLLGSFSCLYAQPGNLGRPPVRNFNRATYKGGTQTWDITTDKQGRIFFANNEGLLEFDGAHWTRHPIANGTIVRSVYFDGTDRYYVGGQGELGYFSPNERGALVFHELTQALEPKFRKFEDVWDIVAADDAAVWFRTDEYLFCYRDQKIQGFQLSTSLMFLGSAGGQLLVQDARGTLHRFQGDHFEPISGAAPLGSPVTAVLPWKQDTVLLTTLKNGIIALSGGQLSPWNTSADAWLKEKRIYSAAVLPGPTLALGTSLGGVLLLTDDRKPTQLIQKSEGLQNNNILSLAPDASGNLWLGEDNGIDLVGINLPFYQMQPDGELEGTGYAAAKYGDMLYLGTSNGLYAHPWRSWYNPFDRPGFKPVSGATGQVWGLQRVNQDLLLGHHEGGFKVNGTQAAHLSAETGVWNYLPLDDTSMLAGTYKGLSLYTRRGGGPWQYRYHLEGFDESSRIMVRDDAGRCWVSHPYRGVFQIGYQAGNRSVTVRSYGTADGLPSGLGNYVYKIAGNVVVAAEKGLYQYDATTNRFVPAKALNTWLNSELHTQLLREDVHGNIWYCQNGSVGVLWVEDHGVEKRVRKEVFPQLNEQLVGGFEYIYPTGNGEVFFATQRGFMQLRARTQPPRDSSVQVFVNLIQLPEYQDSILFGGFNTQGDKTLVLPYAANTLRFAYAAPGLEFDADAQYSVRLEGLDHDWSAWSAKTEKDYPHLPAGKYTIWVKARDGAGKESKPAAYTFRIQPPWYASSAAILCYLAALVAFLYSLFRRQRKRFEAEKEAISTEYQQERAVERRLLEENEQVIRQLQHEKLEVEVQHKNKELALATMHLVQKGEILSTLLEEIEKALQKKQDASALRADMHRIVRTLQLDVQHDDDWQQFAYHFDAVYGGFLKRLREQYPQLSNNDYRLCAYLRMNLSTKEVAHLMNISVRGVEGSRYRLRKKLNLPNEENLVEFLMEL
jgi:ligand-binding sensor domain-containing protein/DNA-binding CsgD family transcriptional regulator